MTAGGFATTLSFDGRDVELSQDLVVLGVGRRLTDTLTLRASAGAVIGGDLSVGGRDFELEPGVLGSLQLSWSLLQAPDAPISLAVALAAGVAASSTTARDDGAEASWLALDVRVSLTASRTFGDVFTPYVSVRAFGGPVLWELDGADVTGSDPRHVQGAVGVSLVAQHRGAAAALVLSIEGTFISETGLMATLGFAL